METNKTQSPENDWIDEQNEKRTNTNMLDINEIFERDGLEAKCTCHCGCTEPTIVLTESQKLNNDCAECHYSCR